SVPEPVDLAAVEAELAAEDGVGVLAEQGRRLAPVAIGPGREAHRPPRVLLLAHQRVLDRLEEATSPELRAGEGPESRDHGGRGDAGVEQLLHGLVRGSSGAPGRALLGRHRIGSDVHGDPFLAVAFTAIHPALTAAAE